MIAALQIDQLTVSYDKAPALWDVSLSVPAGELTAIVGPNGAGKSTLLKACLDLVPVLSGKVDILGEPLSACRQKVAYVPQRESVDWDFPITAFDLVLMGRYGKLGLFSRPRQADREAARSCLNQVGMLAYADRQISQLSGGQQQRIFLARALMQEADVLFLDEPMAGLDMASEKVIMDILLAMKKAGKSIFVVHHDLSTVKANFSWLILLNLRLVASGPVETTFKPDVIETAYGRSTLLFSEASRVQKEVQSGDR